MWVFEIWLKKSFLISEKKNQIHFNFFCTILHLNRPFMHFVAVSAKIIHFTRIIASRSAFGQTWWSKKKSWNRKFQQAQFKRKLWEYIIYQTHIYPTYIFVVLCRFLNAIQQPWNYIPNNLLFSKSGYR